MRTLSEFKRSLKIGMPIKCIYNNISNRNINIQRFIISIQTNGITLNEDKNATKGSFLEFPKASLFEITEKGFKVFMAGWRELTIEEKEVINNEPQDKKQDEIDLMTDTNTMFYKRQNYYKNSPCPYLCSSSKSIQGKYYNKTHNPPLRDDAIKGELSLEYEIGGIE